MNYKSVYKLKHIMLTIYLQLCHNVLTVIQYYIIIKKTKTSRKDLKKEGIMRINSYNKFFAKVAEIMNTEVKAVKQLDGRYKVELANHVYLNVYCGVIGALFVHDHRGLAYITSCYDFEDFKTMKDLYERLIIDYGEITATTTETHYDDYTTEDFIKAGIAKECKACPDFCEEDCIENAECAKGREGNCCYCEQFCNQTWKRYGAIVNPEWHHVRLATLANIDIDMLDEKRQRYFKIYKELIKTLNDLHKCKTAATYGTRWWRFKQAIADDIYYRGTTLYMTRFLDSKISMCNVECGLWSSADEKATSFIKSRRYSHTTLK